MSSSSAPVKPFLDLLCQLATAHGMPIPESPDDVREFAFIPGGALYRLMPQPQDDTQALLEIEITQLESTLDSASASPAFERLLRTLLQLNADLQEQGPWLISLDGDDVLVLSTSFSLMSSTAEAVQVLALEGLQRACAIDEICEELLRQCSALIIKSPDQFTRDDRVPYNRVFIP